MKAKLNTNLLPIISVGMYNTLLDSESIFENQLSEESKLIQEYFWDNFDNEKYIKKIEKLTQYFIEDYFPVEVEGIKINLKAGEIYSPKYYNFETDQIDFEVTYPKAKLWHYCKKHQEKFNDFLNENYSSYDGFYSYTSNNFWDWSEEYENNNEQEVGAALMFLLQNCEDTPNQKDFEYYVYKKISYYTEFCDWSEYDAELK